MTKVKKILGLVLWLCFVHNAAAQEYMPGIYLYNRAQYDSVLAFFSPSFIRSNPQHEGLARYFRGESFYNEALQQAASAQRQTFLHKAWQEFRTAITRDDLRLTFPEYYHFALYKLGWCSFRLAEAGENPAAHLQRAYDEFAAAQADAPDSIAVFSRYMSAECLVLATGLRQAQYSAGRVGAEQLANTAAAYRAAAEQYTRILRFPPGIGMPEHFEQIRALAAMKREMVRYHLGRLYQIASLEDHAATQNSAGQLATAYFASLKYDSLLTSRPSRNRAERAALVYLKLMQTLSQYLLDRDGGARNRFLEVWSELRRLGFGEELWFRRANLHQSDPDVEGEAFNDLTVAFYDSCQRIPEASYWLGRIRMIQGLGEESGAQFRRFIAAAERMAGPTSRLQFLLDDARYRTYLLDFERFYLSDDVGHLRGLAREVAGFVSQHPGMQRRVEMLRLLVNCSLIRSVGRIWTEVLSGTDDEKLEQALSTVRFVLPRAALNIGVIREKYIELLQRLLQITEVRRSDETRFFRGVVTSLEAEIEGTPDAKAEKFRQAARILAGFSEQFRLKDEADYIRAKCLFFADDFTGCMHILRRLVNEGRSLRALFYVAEVFRLDGQGAAARVCYETILDKLRQSGSLSDDFWADNAAAGLASSQESGGLDVLDSLQVDNVVFQPATRSDLTYEQLADERFLQQQAAREMVDWFVEYGLPQKDVYPSAHRLTTAARLYDNLFDDLAAPLDEVRGAVTSTLRLSVILPQGVTSETQVLLDEVPLTGVDREFIKPHLPLKSTHRLVVRNPDCYLFVQNRIAGKPGEEKLVALLNRRLTFRAGERLDFIFKQKNFPFKRRSDANYVLNPLPRLNPEAELVRDFNSRLEMRDCVLDEAGDRILAVDAAANTIWIYSNGPTSRRAGRLDLRLDIPLKSPEGIAVDSRGRIYVCDWGNHRIVVLNRNGELMRRIGAFGSNLPENVGHPIRLEFPTRLAVVQDVTGRTVDGRTVFGQTYLYIADQNGIHLSDDAGNYLGTLVTPGPSLPRGTFYALRVKGYGDQASLVLVGRLGPANGKLFSFLPR